MVIRDVWVIKILATIRIMRLIRVIILTTIYLRLKWLLDLLGFQMIGVVLKSCEGFNRYYDLKLFNISHN
jgi:hypothetical protein